MTHRDALARKMVTLPHGSGGASSRELTELVFKAGFKDRLLFDEEDGGRFASRQEGMAVSTDSYIIEPIFFEGGDIGKLSICGSANDCTVSGAAPKYFTLGFIIEEGFLIQDLKTIVDSIYTELKKLDAYILSADTKVVPRFSKLDKQRSQIFINSTCMGEIIRPNLSAKNLEVGNKIILTSDIGRHGATIFVAQNDLQIDSTLKSDCFSLWLLLEDLLKSDLQIHALRDATRGGIASALNEWATSSKVSIELNEASIKIESEVLGICEILGLEPFVLANEGACLISVSAKDATKTLELLNSSPYGKKAHMVGEVVPSKSRDAVILQNSFGSKRYLEYPQGEILPRIC
ncbi:hydrogenase expression/formation protein HypE [Helicobacter sp. 11S02629-2]|uniref:hydrogenase expression/formation protein HypE n=1 Tax=Helicobacter sp. 11S02629-2 TaxID=1476195 RepID=UPI00215136E9|nr:hydrogenase expression/formation protein HypE [Helicobacter sp. 11S02629-2]